MAPPTPADPRDLLGAALTQDPARPLITFYDDATGERVELSVATFANWVAKTANFLSDGLGAAPGARVSIRLPPHWQSAVWLGACWAIGAVPVLGGGRVAAGGTVADVAVLAADDADPPPPADELVVLGLGPFGLPRPGAGTSALAGSAAVDYDSEIHSHGDRFTPSAGAADADDPVALEIDGMPLRQRELAKRTEQALAKWHLQWGDRVLGISSLDTLPAVLAMLVVPLAAGVGAVLCRHLDPFQLSDRVRTERVVALLEAPGLPAEMAGAAGPSYLPDLGRS